MVKNPVRRARVRRLVGSVAVSFVVVPAAMAAVVATAGPASAAPSASSAASTSVRWNGVAPAGRWNVAPTGRWNAITPDCGRWNGTPPVNA